MDIKQQYRKIIIMVWLVFAALWSAVCVFAFVLGAGMSVGDANIEPGFLLYWLIPMLIPAAIYKLVVKSARNTK